MLDIHRVGLIASVDTTYFDSVVRRDSKEINLRIKSGLESAELLYSNPHVRCQKDLDAKFSKKYNNTHFGFKVSLLVDSQTRIILNTEVTLGNVHDVMVLEKVIETSAIKPKLLYGDSGYMGEAYANRLKLNHGVTLLTCKRRMRNQSSLTKKYK